MPYRSTRIDQMDAAAIDRYRAASSDHIGAVVERVDPDVVHVNHLWLVAAMAKQLAPRAFVVAHSHGTGLRQLVLCPHLAPEVRAGCARLDHALALHGELRAEITAELGLAPDRVSVVGAGYRDELFGPGAPADRDPDAIVYAGKLAAAKGLPWLLDAVERLARRRRVVLHVAGGGGGDESEQLRRRIEALAPSAVYHGMLDQPALADLMRRSTAFVLPSMFEGLPLVLIEALACGCRAVATDLPGVRDQLAPHLTGLLERVPVPRRTDVDRPVAEELPAFVDALEAALERALAAGAVDDPTLLDRLRPFTWDAVFERVEDVWRRGLGDRHR